MILLETILSVLLYIAAIVALVCLIAILTGACILGVKVIVEGLRS